MIKTGINLSPLISADLIRLLINHPDVDLRWVAGPSMPAEGVSAVFDQLQGEVGEVSVDADFQAIDLYIGNDFQGLEKFLNEQPKSKAIVLGPQLRPLGYDEAVLGVCEYNRKALVRGARLALQPDIPTILGAIALMPLAKNLMLNAPVAGTMLLPQASMRGAGDFRCAATTLSPGAFKPLREQILEQLQTSFNAPIEITAIENTTSHFACAILTVDIKMGLDQVRRIYKEFYDDHRHIVFPTHAVNEAMVHGTNKTVVGLGHDGLGRLIVTVGFDARYKGAAGNVLHLLNLLFGLDERIGF